MLISVENFSGKVGSSFHFCKGNTFTSSTPELLCPLWYNQVRWGGRMALKVYMGIGDGLRESRAQHFSLLSTWLLCIFGGTNLQLWFHSDWLCMNYLCGGMGHKDMRMEQMETIKPLTCPTSKPTAETTAGFCFFFFLVKFHCAIFLLYFFPFNKISLYLNTIYMCSQVLYKDLYKHTDHHKQIES